MKIGSLVVIQLLLGGCLKFKCIVTLNTFFKKGIIKLVKTEA